MTFGGIAQLGERLNGIQEVSGSIPLISTKRPEIVRFQVFFFFYVYLFDTTAGPLTRKRSEVLPVSTASLRRKLPAPSPAGAILL